MHSLLLAAFLVAQYTAVPGTDPEYGQVAIEKCDVRHAEIARFVWLIEVSEPDASEWQRKLNAAVDPSHGSFRVRSPTREEEEKGKGKLQR